MDGSRFRILLGVGGKRNSFVGVGQMEGGKGEKEIRRVGQIAKLLAWEGGGGVVD